MTSLVLAKTHNVPKEPACFVDSLLFRAKCSVREEGQPVLGFWSFAILVWKQRDTESSINLFVVIDRDSELAPHACLLNSRFVVPDSSNRPLPRQNLFSHSPTGEFTENEVVGAPGFEPGASCAQGRRATRLRYAPTVCAY